jgi:hypothetical protein
MLLIQNIDSLTFLGACGAAFSMCNALVFTIAPITFLVSLMRKELSLRSAGLNPGNGPSIGVKRWLWRYSISLLIDSKFDKPLLDYVKNIFDGLKQITMVVPIAFALIYIQKPMISYKFPCFLQAMVNWTYLVLMAILIAMAFIWMLHSFNGGAFLKWFHRATLIFFGVIALWVLSYHLTGVYMNLPFDITSTQKNPHQCTETQLDFSWELIIRLQQAQE